MDTAFLLILEDDTERLNRFELALSKTGLAVTIKSWPSAIDMIADLDKYLADTRLISLDHDLYPEDDADDPGDGLMMARHLASMPPVCPVIVHTSNVDRGNQMQGSLELEDWAVKRVGPIGGDWVEADWIVVVEELLHPR